MNFILPKKCIKLTTLRITIKNIHQDTNVYEVGISAKYPTQMWMEPFYGLRLQTKQKEKEIWGPAFIISSS